MVRFCSRTSDHSTDPTRFRDHYPLPQSPEGKGQVPGKGKGSGRSDVRYDDQGNEMWD